MPEHPVATREEWLAACDELLSDEKEHTRRNDEIAKRRRELPWVEVDKEYTFDTEDGTKTLAGLFDGRSQLVIYHFMYGPAYTTGGCPVCSSVAGGFDGAIPHLNARDVTFTCVSRAPLEKLRAYKERMDWSFPWASSGDSFNFEFGASHTEEELRPFLEGDVGPVVEGLAKDCGTDPAGYVSEGPVLSSFALEDGTVYQTYSTGARGLEFMMTFYGFLDRAPLGRNEGDPPEGWIKRPDEY
jgi:predicted dithiol-disulfide oxidoreductase (DUF899 family)